MLIASGLAPPSSNLFGGAKTDDKKDAPAVPTLFGSGQTTSQSADANRLSFCWIMLVT
jgi:hypothetical protein